MVKKDFTKAAANVAERFFSPQGELDAEDKYANNTKHTHATNKSKHYDQRGKRDERFGLLMDSQLKEDLKSLTNATGSRSVNDLIVTVLLEYVEAPENQEILNKYRKLRNTGEEE